jgi:hypothetical protein
MLDESTNRHGQRGAPRVSLCSANPWTPAYIILDVLHKKAQEEQQSSNGFKSCLNDSVCFFVPFIEQIVLFSPFVNN